MPANILVTYATRCNSTREVAEYIAEQLGAAVLPMEKVTDLDAYDTVIIGSAIRFANWLPEAKRFVEQHKNELATKFTAYFTLCATLHQDTPENRHEVEGYLKPILAIHQPQAVGFFAGRLDYRRVPYPHKLLRFLKVKPEGDFRDWNAIRTWAANLLITRVA